VLSGTRRVAYGYNIGEVELPDIREWKKVHIHTYESHLVTQRERRPVAVSSGPNLRGHALPRVNPDDTPTVLAGIYKRVAAKLPEADTQLLDEFNAFVKRWLRRNLTPLEHDTDISVPTWLQQCNYPYWRKLELEEEYNTFNTNEPMNEKDRQVKSFVKDESYADWKHARMINSRSDRFKIYCGPVIRAVEQRVFKLPHFIKKVPIAERPSVILRDVGDAADRWVATDYTSFEANFTPRFMQACELEMLRYMTKHLPGHKEWMKTIEDTFTGVNHCKFRQGWFEITACRMSGEMCTSLHNGFANLMAFLFVCEKSGVQVRLKVEGDDGIAAISGPVDQSLFARMGLMIKLEKHAALSEASFCGLVFAPEDCINVTDPREVLAEFAWCSKRYAHSSSHKLRALLRCKALSLAHQYPGCPIIDALGHYGIRVTRRYHMGAVSIVEKSRSYSMWEREQIRDAVTCGQLHRTESPPATRELVERLYGITVEQQKQIEAMLDSKMDFDEIDIELQGLPRSWSKYRDLYVLTPVDLNRPNGDWHQHNNCAFNVSICSTTFNARGDKIRPVY